MHTVGDISNSCSDCNYGKNSTYYGTDSSSIGNYGAITWVVKVEPRAVVIVIWIGVPLCQL